MSRAAKWCRALCLAAATLPGLAQAAALLPWENTRSYYEYVTHDGVKYRVGVIRPEHPADGAPAVITVHYNDGNASAMANLTEVGQLARDHGAWVILPEAPGNVWQIDPDSTPDRDDMGFFNQLIDHVVHKYNVDSRRVYMMGYSQGGYVTTRFACDYPGKIAAGATVAATMRKSVADVCAPAVGTPMMFIHGTADNQIPYDPNLLQEELRVIFGNLALSAPAAAQFWATADGCTNGPVRRDLPDLVDDGTTTYVNRYDGCANNAAVELYTVQNGGHAWPGAMDFIPRVGLTSQDFRAQDEMWKFFTQFHR